MGKASYLYLIKQKEVPSFLIHGAWMSLIFYSGHRGDLDLFVHVGNVT
jgi:hypothetical protein